MALALTNPELDDFTIRYNYLNIHINLRLRFKSPITCFNSKKTNLFQFDIINLFYYWCKSLDTFNHQSNHEYSKVSHRQSELINFVSYITYLPPLLLILILKMYYLLYFV